MGAPPVFRTWSEVRAFVYACREYTADQVRILRGIGADDLLIIAGARDVADEAAAAGDPHRARVYRALAHATVHHIHTNPAEGGPL